MSFKKSKLLIIQPALVHYRVPVYNGIADFFETTVIGNYRDPQSSPEKFDWIESKLWNVLGIKWQFGVVRFLLIQRPSHIYLAADLNYFSSIVSTLLAKLLGIKIILNGQGVIKKGRFGNLKKAVLKQWTAIATLYVAYAKPCENSLLEAGFNGSNLCTVENRFEGNNKFPPPDASILRKDVLFIGRPRAGSRLEWLIKAHAAFTAKSPSQQVILHLIGVNENDIPPSEIGGAAIRFYGKVVDPQEISKIANSCCIGVYPGRAGLSVIDFLALSLPVVAATELTEHMGPEPHHIVDGFNGWNFKFHDFDDFSSCYEKALNLSIKDTVYSEQALASYQRLHSKSYAEELVDAISLSTIRASSH